MTVQNNLFRPAAPKNGTCNSVHLMHLSIDKVCKKKLFSPLSQLLAFAFALPGSKDVDGAGSRGQYGQTSLPCHSTVSLYIWAGGLAPEPRVRARVKVTEVSS